MNWVKEEDVNSCYFHIMMKARFRRNSISVLTAEDQVLLQQPFTSEEIEEALSESDGNKSLGPDDFNLEFLKRCWDVIGVESTGSLVLLGASIKLSLRYWLED
ncbi:unnamed protein product [Lathyrus sativus]|nr:unnamed protein product [Lathyrus sativus]